MKHVFGPSILMTTINYLKQTKAQLFMIIENEQKQGNPLSVNSYQSMKTTYHPGCKIGCIHIPMD